MLRELRNCSDSKVFLSKTECQLDDVDAAVNADLLQNLGLDEMTVPLVEWINRLLSDPKELHFDKGYTNLTTI